jgi:hypothetical protein
MITIELTEIQIEHLKQGAEDFGRCSMLLEAKDGMPVFVVVMKNRRGRPRKLAGAAEIPNPGMQAAQAAELDELARLREPA